MSTTVKYVINDTYLLGEIYHFRNPNVRSGFVVADGHTIPNANISIPQMWNYLQTSEGSSLKVSQATYNSKKSQQWGTGSIKGSWGGVGGVAYFVQDLVNNTLQVPDLRNVSLVAYGSDASTVGECYGDTTRQIVGRFCSVFNWQLELEGRGPRVSGAFDQWEDVVSHSQEDGTHHAFGYIHFHSGSSVPVGVVNAPKRVSLLPCIYVGGSD